MNLAIIGAGLAGLAAARALAPRSDIAVTIFEKSRGPGGRAATRRRDGFTFDHGAQLFKLPTPALRDLVERTLPTEGLFTIDLPVWVFDSAGSIAPGDPQQNDETSYSYRDGISQLGKLLAEGLDVRCETRVVSLASAGAGYTLRDTDGRDHAGFDAVLLTAPAPQTAEILAASAIDEPRKQALLAALGPVSYRRCLSFALAYPAPLERPWYAVVNNDRGHPMAWLAREQAKNPGRVPDGHSLLIAQMAPGWSVERWDTPPDLAAAEVHTMAAALLGEPLPAPLWVDRQGWRYGLPSGKASFEALNDGGDGLYFAGDFTEGAGRAHLAIESGWRAASLI